MWIVVCRRKSDAGPLVEPRPGPLAWRRTLATICLAAAAGCAPEAESPIVEDPEFDGLTREQIEQQAEPMTPAEAERLGIVDTTIRIEPPIDPDSILTDSVSPR